MAKKFQIKKPEKRAQPASAYVEGRLAFHQAVVELAGLSFRLAGTPSPHRRQYWSSMLMAKMALTAGTLDKIVPQDLSEASDEVWDLSSIATLVRVLAENYLLLQWLCVETLDDEELWDFRYISLIIVDNRARYRMVEEVEGAPEPPAFVDAQAKLGAQLAALSLFQAQAPSRQRELLKGNKTPFIHDDVIDTLEFEREEFRKFYRYLSSFVHTGTVSFFRAAELGRGHGGYNHYEADAILGCITFTANILTVATEQVTNLQGL